MPKAGHWQIEFGLEGGQKFGKLEWQEANKKSLLCCRSTGEPISIFEAPTS